MKIYNSKVGWSLVVLDTIFILEMIREAWGCNLYGDFIAPLGCLSRILSAFPWWWISGFVNWNNYWFFYLPNLIVLYFLGFSCEKIIRKIISLIFKNKSLIKK